MKPASDPARVNLNYRVLLQVTNVLNSQRDTEGLWRAIADQIKRVVSWERASLSLYHKELDAFKFYAVETSIPLIELKRDSVIPRIGSAFGWVYDHHRLHVRPRLQADRLFFEDEFYYREGLGRMINLPLLVHDSCLGTLNIGSIHSGEPEPDDIEFLQHVAAQIALAIDHVWAYEEIDKLREQLARENAYLVEELKETHNFGAMVGKSRLFQNTLSLAQAVAGTTTTVLITGETGTGKELLARLIHEFSARRDKAFVRVNCASLPSGLVESELFGHERGAFTGAEQRRPGRFELANGGTLFLDEIGEMPLDVQAKLLRVLQDGLVDRVGGTQSVPVDVRIIAATNADLVSAIADGRFRSDLFYRLHVFPIVVPPLRDRPEDIPLLARHFLDQARVKLKRPCEVISDQCMERLMHYAWPGNVRELQSVIERSVILSNDPVLTIDEVTLTPAGSTAQTESLLRLGELERTHILRTLERTNWRIEGRWGAANQLGINPSTLRSRLKKLGIKRSSDADEASS